MFMDSQFNQPIGNWDVSSVTNMSLMFNSTNFNQSIVNCNVSNVSNMNSMFKFNYKFNHDLSNWDVSSVTDCDLFNDMGSSTISPLWTLPKPNFTNCNPSLTLFLHKLFLFSFSFLLLNLPSLFSF